MYEEHQHIRFAVRFVAVGEVVGNPVHLGHDAADLQRRNAVRAHQLIQVFGDGPDEPKLHSLELLEEVLVIRRPTGRPVVQIGGEIRPVGRIENAVIDVGATLVELVVAKGTRFETDLVEHIDGRLVVLDERREGGCSDKVTGTDECGVGVRFLPVVDHATQLRGTGNSPVSLEPAVEVVHREDLDVDRGYFGAEPHLDRVVVAGTEDGSRLGGVELVSAIRPLWSVDAPGPNAGDVVGQRRRHEHVVEGAELAVEGVCVLVVGLVRQHIGVAGRGKHLDRVFFGVCVEVTNQENVVALRLVGDDAVDERLQAGGLRDAVAVEVALAVSRLCAASRFGLEVVGDDREHLAIARRLEGLGQRLAGVAPHALVDLRETVADQAHRCRLVDDGVGDEVGDRGILKHGGRAHIIPAASSGGRVESCDEIGERLVGGFPELHRIFDLHEADDVSAESVDCGHDLGLLDGEVCGGACTAGVRVFAAQRREVVEDVERTDSEVAANRWRGCRARVGWRKCRLVRGRAGVADRNRRLEPPVVEPVAENVWIGRPADGVAVSNHGVWREVWLGSRVAAVGHLDVVAVIEEEPVGPVGGGDRGGGGSGIRRLGALHGVLTGIQPERSVVEQLVAR